MKVLVIGGMHGNEPLGMEVVGLLMRKPIGVVDFLVGNPRAVIAQQRFTGEDLNRSFPGEKTSSIYEQARAAFILNKCKKYDIVLDFHNTHCPDNDCSFVGEKSTGFLADISCFLGLKRIIVADYDCLNKYASNCLSIEVSLTSKYMDSRYWYEKIYELSKIGSTVPAVKPQFYEFVHRISLQEKEQLSLPSYNLRAFEPLPKMLANRFGFSEVVYPIFIDDAYTPYNYGGLLKKRQNLGYNRREI